MSRQRAINAKCKDCIYDPLCGGGTWRQQVEACAIKTCALWPYRPKSRARPRAYSQVAGDAKTDTPQVNVIMQSDIERAMEKAQTCSDYSERPPPKGNAA